MPLGAARLSFLAKSTVTAVAEVIRRKVGVSANGNAQLDTAQYKFGNASAYLDGVNDYLELDSAIIPSTDDFTFECWLQVPSLPGETKYIWSQYLGGATGRAGGYLRTTGEIGIFVNGGVSAYTTTQLSTNTWYHIVWTRTGNDWEIFINGTSSLTNSSGGTIYTGANTVIGWRDSGAGDINGWIDEVRISDTVRYTTGFSVETIPFTNDDNTLLLLHMDGTDGSTFIEDDNGVRTPISVSVNGDAQVDTARANFGGASAVFDGTGDYLTANQVLNVGTGDFTSEFWYYSTTTGTKYIHDIVDSTNSGFQTRWSFTSNTLIFRDINNGSTSNLFTTSASLSTFAWNHIAIVRNSGTTTIYHNGSSIGSTTSFTRSMNNMDAYYGGINGFTGITGNIDEVRVSDTARYTSGFTPSTTPFTNDDSTLLLLHCDGTDATTVFRDDNGKGRAPIGVSGSNSVQVDTAQSYFGGASALFDTLTDDYIILHGNESDVDFSGDFTIECFFRSTDVANNRKIFDARGIQATHEGGDTVVALAGTILIDHNASAIRVYLDGADRASGSTSVSNDTWHHIAVTRSSGTVNAWLDGTRIVNYSHTDDFTNVFNVNQPIGVGASTSTLSQKFDGHIDEFRITTDARYSLGASITVPTEQFTNDANTYLLLHMDGSDGNTTFVDDNGTYTE